MDIQIIAGLAALILGAIGIFNIYASLKKRSRLHQLAIEGRTARARTVEAGWRRKANARVFTTQYEYVVDGQPFQSSIDYNLSRFAPDGTFDVLYSPEDPSDHTVTAMGTLSYVIGGFIIGGLLIAFSGFILAVWVLQII